MVQCAMRHRAKHAPPYPALPFTPEDQRLRCGTLIDEHANRMSPLRADRHIDLRIFLAFGVDCRLHDPDRLTSPFLSALSPCVLVPDVFFAGRCDMHGVQGAEWLLASSKAIPTAASLPPSPSMPTTIGSPSCRSRCHIWGITTVDTGLNR